MSLTIVIPARYGSTRFPAKPLAALRGATGVPRSLIARCIDAARAVSVPHRLVVATDDPRIVAEAEAAGAEAMLTAETCRNGTERVAAVAAALRLPPGDVVVNLQGDAPLTPPWFVEALYDEMMRRAGAMVATPVLRCDSESLAHFLADRAAGRVGATTVVTAGSGDALYFSKEVIPFTNGRTRFDGAVPVFHHVGLYAYRPAALAAYSRWRPTPLEEIEGLEQLRFLEAGWSIRAVEVDARGRPFWEVNNPEDIPRIEAQLAALGIA